MTDFPRLRDEPESELERSLLSAGHSYAASAGARAKTLAALGVVGAAASATTAAATVTKAGALKWLACAGLIAAVTVPAVHYLRKAAPHGEAPPQTPAATTVAEPAAQTPAPSEPLAVPAPLGPTANSAPPPSTAAAAAAPLNTAKPATGAQGLAAELAALDTARAALTAGDANGALASLDAYARNFPHGKLSLEAEVLRIDALAKSGQTAAAQKRAQAFIKRHPDSVLASRVRAYAGQ